MGAKSKGNKKPATQAPAQGQAVQNASITPVKQFDIDTPIDTTIKNLKKGFYTLSMRNFFKTNISLEYSNVLGRYVMATRNIKQGTQIFGQDPYCAVVLDHLKETVCSACFTPFVSGVICGDCKQTYYCSQTCFRNHASFHRPECRTLGTFSTLGFEGDTASLRLILRIAIAKAKQEPFITATSVQQLAKLNAEDRLWKPKEHVTYNDVSSLIDHSDKIDDTTRKQILNVLTKMGRLVPSEFWGPDTALEMVDVYLKIKYNAFYITDINKSMIGVGLYTSPSYLNHSCSPNSYVTFDHGRLILRALRDILPGEEITHACINLYQPSWIRRVQLQQQLQFDPAQDERYLPRNRIVDDYAIGGLKCSQCPRGLLNYHVIKHYELPTQVTLKDHKEDTTDHPEGNATATTIPEGTTPVDATAATTTTTPAFVTPARIPIQDIKPADMTNVVCNCCKFKVPVSIMDIWIKHCRMYLDTLGQLFQQRKLEQLQGILENGILKWTSLPKAILDDDKIDDIIRTYNSMPLSQYDMNVLPEQLARFVPTHYIMYDAYQWMCRIARLTNDFMLLNKYAQLSMLSLQQQTYLTINPEYADVLIDLGDTNSYLSGNMRHVHLQSTSSSHPVMITDQSITTLHLNKALEYYKLAYTIRKNTFGESSQLSRCILTYINTIQNALKPTPVAGNKNNKKK